MITHLHDLDALEAAIAESCQRPVLLFKHSRTCGISCEALDELNAHVEQVQRGGQAPWRDERESLSPSAAASAVYKVITVQSHRHLSDETAARLGVRHQTPQAILLRGGKPVWKASHFRITADALTEALS